ncbi:unnamed protein product [Rotaria magnacalcarata]|uniref:Uncharacterized protein n=3 Tax=Rotaria magnacalcarata TaxID=392030 RepID=A0A816X7J7_9BILA|nr:unnamed protein product [Rotaria magnacalcarata]CAF4173009.1 unnamed protein product [Rotaria magnacalcarata]
MGCTVSKTRLPELLPKRISLHHDAILSSKKPVSQSTRFLENFLTIWLYDEASNKYENEMEHLGKLLYGLKTFNNIETCNHFINNVRDEKIFLILSGIHRTCEHFHDFPQLEKIYIFDCSHEINDTKHRIFKYDIIQNVDSLYRQLQENIRICEMDFTPITVVSASSPEISFSSKLTRQEALFLFAQMLKEIIARLKFESCSKDVLIEFCRIVYTNHDEQLRAIDEFANNYRPNKALYCLTNQSFISRILNRVVRTHEIDILYKLGFFIKQATIQLNRLHEENKVLIETIFMVYRGKTMSCLEFETVIKNNCGGFLSFPNFLIASINKKFAIDFIDRRLAMHRDMIGILFEIDIAKTTFDEKSPFALLKDADADNDSVCFNMSTIFRIQSVEQITNGEMLMWSVQLKLINNDDQQVQYIIASTRQDEVHANPAFHLGKLLVDMGEYKRAEQFLLSLLQDTAVLSQPRRLVRVHNGLAAIYTYNHDYVKALNHYHEVLRLSLTYLQSDHLDLIPIYKVIGDNHYNQKEYSNALENYEKAIKLLEQNTSSMNVDMSGDLQNSISMTKQLLKTHP